MVNPWEVFNDDWQGKEASSDKVLTSVTSANVFKLMKWKNFQQSYKFLRKEQTRILPKYVPKEALEEMDLNSWLSTASLTTTKHFQEQRRKYAGTPELLDRENDILKIDETLQNHVRSEIKKGTCALVEIGLNKQNQACKFGITLQAPDSKRTLFLCIGIDKNIKTFYITNAEKKRRTYKARDGIKTLTKKETRLLFGKEHQ